MGDVDEAVKALDAHKRNWSGVSKKMSPIEERMMALEEVVKKSFTDSARKAASAVTSGAPIPRSYASVVALHITKTVIRIRIDGADKLQPE